MSASITSGSYPRAVPSVPGFWRRAGRALWRSMQRTGQLRAVPHLLALANRYQHSDPQLAQHLREAARHNAEG